MRRRGLILVLAIGAIAGFASGLYGCHYHGVERRQAFEDHIADVCTRAAERSRSHASHVENAP
jgi:gas vesicle protein